MPRERAPGSPRVPESIPGSSRPAGPRTPQGLPREVSPATRPFLCLPAAAHVSPGPPFPRLSASGSPCPFCPPFPLPSPRAGWPRLTAITPEALGSRLAQTGGRPSGAAAHPSCAALARRPHPRAPRLAWPACPRSSHRAFRPLRRTLASLLLAGPEAPSSLVL